MQIISSKDALEQLMVGSRGIWLSYAERSDVSTLLDSIDGLEISFEPVFNDFTSLATIYPIRSAKEVIYCPLPQTLVEKLSGYKAEILNVPDFSGSDELYTKLSRKSSRVKVIEDKFSAERGAMLFKYISELEKSLRKRYHDFYNTEELTKSKDYISKHPDHFINYYGLSEMLNEQLLSPASNEFYLEMLETATDRERKLQAREYTRLEEIGLPISVENLKKFARIRNAVMHFRTVTYRDTEFLLNLSADYQAKEMEHMLKKTESRSMSSGGPN